MTSYRLSVYREFLHYPFRSSTFDAALHETSLRLWYWKRKLRKQSVLEWDKLIKTHKEFNERCKGLKEEDE